MAGFDVDQRVTADIGAKVAGGTSGFFALRHAVKEGRRGVRAIPKVAKEAYDAFRAEMPKSAPKVRIRVDPGLKSTRRAKAVAAILRSMRKRGVPL